MYNKKSKIELKKTLEREDFKRITCSFYKYFSISDPNGLRDRLYKNLEKLNILGRIYVAFEGINAQISIPDHKLKIFKQYIQSIEGLSDLQFKYAVEEGVSFIKLKILVRDEIVAYKVPEDSYDMNKTGTHLKPVDFHKSIKEDDSVLVDMRNYYESEVGKFKDAIIPGAHFSKELLPKVAKLLEEKKDKKVHLYCTGGIRCEKASSYLIKKGFKEVYQLEGGVIQYAHDIKDSNLESEFIGKNFVFDDRMGERVTDDIISYCHQCKKPSDHHKNCNNDACHLLFIQCDNCSNKFKDCCSEDCMNFSSLDIDTQRKLRKDENKKVSSAKLSTKFRPKLYKLFNYWK
tara:strand:- start:882 stop:1919 length:1038 start_codon:yes stop_codon:yes gene_type:complete